MDAFLIRSNANVCKNPVVNPSRIYGDNVSVKGARFLQNGVAWLPHPEAFHCRRELLLRRLIRQP